MHSAVFLTFIKLPFVIKIVEWPFYTGFTIIISIFLGAFSDDGPSCFLTASLSTTVCQQDDSWLTSDEFYTCYFCAHVYKGKFISVLLLVCLLHYVNKMILGSLVMSFIPATFVLMYIREFVGVLRLSLFGFALLCVLSCFAITLKRKR